MKIHIVKTKNMTGIVEECESLVECPYCSRPMDYVEFEKQWEKGPGMIRKKCKFCKMFFGIVQNMAGDWIGFKL